MVDGKHHTQPYKTSRIRCKNASVFVLGAKNQRSQLSTACNFAAKWGYTPFLAATVVDILTPPRESWRTGIKSSDNGFIFGADGAS